MGDLKNEEKEKYENYIAMLNKYIIQLERQLNEAQLQLVESLCIKGE